MIEAAKVLKKEGFIIKFFPSFFAFYERFCFSLQNFNTEKSDIMAKNLVIVESPAKAKTIEGFLGKDFLVKSSFGHVRDLSKSKLGVDIEKNFQPQYEIPADKKKVVAELKKETKNADLVWLATDEDREGEAISWHLVESLKIPKNKYKRIVFHEITKKAITNAIENPRQIDTALVNAQQARRVLDRLVGFELSPVLWKKVRPSLSAGRVQSVAVRLIVEREKEIQSFKAQNFYKVIAEFDFEHNGQQLQFKAELAKKLPNKETAFSFLQKCAESSFSVESVETKPSRKTPSAPFTTSTLQQEASRKLGFSVSRTMVLAQKLYESGKITYMRTDSVNLSDSVIASAKKQITEIFGQNYAKPRKYASKTKGAQEAHEAIRPTDISRKSCGGDPAEQKLYELIWKRTIASQMADAVLEKTQAKINISKSDEILTASGEVIKFDGFLKLYIESKEEEDEETSKGILPPLKVGQKLNLNNMQALERFIKHAPRYTEAGLVKKLEELGIGRPSTYAPTISVIQNRQYVVKESREGEKRKFCVLELKNDKILEIENSENTGFEKNKLFPTDLGTVVNNFLVEYFKDIIDYNFTAKLEKEFDEIAQKNTEWESLLKEFYWPFHKKVENALEKSERVSGERLLGKDPASGKNVYVKIGRYGPMVQIGESNEEEKPKFAGLLKNQSIDTISLEDALELFKLPRKVGEFEGKEVVAAVGRFGPYLRHDGKFVSLPKTEDPLSVKLDKAIEIIQNKREAEKKKIIKTFENEPDIKVLMGRWGPYISYKGENIKIPKNVEPEKITLKEIEEIKSKSKATSGKKKRTTKSKSSGKKK